MMRKLQKEGIQKKQAQIQNQECEIEEPLVNRQFLFDEIKEQCPICKMDVVVHLIASHKRRCVTIGKRIHKPKLYSTNQVTEMRPLNINHQDRRRRRHKNSIQYYQTRQFNQNNHRNQESIHQRTDETSNTTKPIFQVIYDDDSYQVISDDDSSIEFFEPPQRRLSQFDQIQNHPLGFSLSSINFENIEDQANHQVISTFMNELNLMAEGVNNLSDLRQLDINVISTQIQDEYLQIQMEIDELRRTSFQRLQDTNFLLQQIPLYGFEPIPQRIPLNQSNYGMNVQQINQFPKTVFKKDIFNLEQQNEDNNTNLNCVICVSDFQNGENMRTLNCLHKFHVQCIDKWLKIKGQCPICRCGLN